MKRFILVAFAALVAAPALVSAQQLGGLETLLTSIGRLVRLALPIVMGLALLAFFWGLVKFIFQQGSDGDKVEAKKIMIWAVVAFFVMISIWGLVRFMQDALGINPAQTPPFVPTVPGI